VGAREPGRIYTVIAQLDKRDDLEVARAGFTKSRRMCVSERQRLPGGSD
jgi:hypothetical protein